MTRPIIIATHPRSGTHLTIDLLRKQFKECQSWLWFGETVHHSYITLDHLTIDSSPRIDMTLAKSLLSRCERPICKTHSLPDFSYLEGEELKFVKNLLSQSDIYYVVRDGRSVLCSSHLWAQEFDSQARCSFSEFIRQEKNGMSYPKYWAYHVNTWLKNSQAKILRFEDNLKKTAEMIEKISEDLQLKPLYKQPLLPQKRTRGDRLEAYWLRLTRNYEASNIVGRYQKKKPKKWQENFSYEDRLFFEQETNGLLTELGYETSDEWIKSA